MARSANDPRAKGSEMRGGNSWADAIRSWVARRAGLRFLRINAPPRKLPGAGQIVMQHLRRRAWQRAHDQFVARADASRESLIGDLLDLHEDSRRSRGE